MEPKIELQPPPSPEIWGYFKYDRESDRYIKARGYSHIISVCVCVREREAGRQTEVVQI